MTTQRFTNFATSQLAAPIGVGDLSLAVTPATGALFPTLTGSDFFYVVLTDSLTAPTVNEVVQVTARVNDTFTIVRAQDNTVARAWTIGNYISHRLVSATFGAMSFTGETTFDGLGGTAMSVVSNPGVPTGVLADFEVGISAGSNASDVAAVRAFCSTAGTATSAMGRGLESQSSIALGATIAAGGTFGLEVGLHSQVAGNGFQSIGIYCASSHVGWLSSGVRNDVGIAVVGADGWKYGYVYNDTNGARLFDVDQTGLLFTKGGGYTSGLSAERVGWVIPSQAPAGETWFGMRYDSTNLTGVLEVLKQGTAWRNIALAPSGGNVLIGSAVDDGGGEVLQVYGIARLAAGTAAPAGGSVAARMTLGPIGTLGVYYGSGVPTVSGGKGSLYLRTDGSSTTTRAYINTDGATTWTAISTVA